MFNRFKKFVVNVTKATKKKMLQFIKDCFNHTESIILLVTSSIGITKILSKFPLRFTIRFIKNEMVIPVAAVAIVIGLIRDAKVRKLKLALAV